MRLLAAYLLLGFLLWFIGRFKSNGAVVRTRFVLFSYWKPPRASPSSPAYCAPLLRRPCLQHCRSVWTIGRNQRRPVFNHLGKQRRKRTAGSHCSFSFCRSRTHSRAPPPCLLLAHSPHSRSLPRVCAQALPPGYSSLSTVRFCTQSRPNPPSRSLTTLLVLHRY